MNHVCPTCYQEIPPGMDLTVSLDENCVLWKGHSVQFTPIEAEILHVLANEKNGGWVHRDRVYAAVYGAGPYPESRTFMVHRVRINRKFRDADVPICIESSWYRHAGAYKYRLKYGHD